MTIRDTELRGVEIPVPEPDPGSCWSYICPCPARAGAAATPRMPSALTHASLARHRHSEVAVSQLTDPRRLMKHSQKEGAMGENTAAQWRRLQL